MWDSSHTHTHHTINQIGASQSPTLKSLTSSLGPTLWSNFSEPTRGCWVDSDTICNDPRKSVSYICAIPQKDQLQLRLLVVVNKAHIYPVNIRCGTHHIPTHIRQSIKLGPHTNTLDSLGLEGFCVFSHSNLFTSRLFLVWKVAKKFLYQMFQFSSSIGHQSSIWIAFLGCVFASASTFVFFFFFKKLISAFPMGPVHCSQDPQINWLITCILL